MKTLVAENIFVAREKTSGGIHIDHKAQLKHAQELLNRLEADIDATAQVADLRIGQQQMVEIAKALSLNARVLLLDEPTEGIQPNIIQQIGRVIRILCDQGDMAIVLVEQYFDFAYELGDEFTVMKRGAVSFNKRANGLERQTLYDAVMV